MRCWNARVVVKVVQRVRVAYRRSRRFALNCIPFLACSPKHLSLSANVIKVSRSIAYLLCGNELKRAEGSLQVGGVGLEIVESASDAGLELRWLLAGLAVGGDLVKGRHDCGCCRLS